MQSGEKFEDFSFSANETLDQSLSVCPFSLLTLNKRVKSELKR